MWTASALGTAALAWILTYVLHSTVLLGGVWLLARTRALSSPRRAERAWRLAVIGPLVTATLQLGLGREPVLGGWTIAPPERTAALERTAAKGRAEPAPETPVATRERAAQRPPSNPADAAPPARTPGGPPAAETSLPSLAPTRPGEDRVAGAPVSIGEPAISSSRPPQRIPVRRPLEPSKAGLEPRADASPGRAEGTRAVQAAGPPPDAAVERAGSGVLLRSPAPQHWARALLSDLEGWLPDAPLLAALAGGLPAALGLLGFALGWGSLRRRLAGRRAIEDGPLVETLEALRRRAGLRARVRLSVAPRLRVPIAIGLVRREICLPERALDELSPVQQESVLAHELAHTARRDPAWFGVVALLERAAFFQPLNRVARRRLAEAAELACDDLAVRWTGRRLPLASSLTEIARWIVPGERPLPVPAMAETTSRLGRRVERLLDKRWAPAPEPRARLFAPAALASLGLVALAVPGGGAERGAASPAPVPLADPPAAPAPAPAPPAVPAPLPRAAVPAPAGLRDGATALEREMRLLEAEVDELSRELASLPELHARFAARLSEIESRTRALRSRRDTLRELLPRILPEAASLPTNPPRTVPAHEKEER